MTDLNMGPTVQNIIIGAGTQTITWLFVDSAGAATDETGTWQFEIRYKVESAATSLVITPTVTQAAVGQIDVTITEAQSLALVQTGADRFVGEYTLEKDTVPEFQGAFTIDQKATRS